MKPLLKCLINVFNIFIYTYIQTLVLSLEGQSSFKQNVNTKMYMHIRMSSSYKLTQIMTPFAVI